LWAGQLWVNKKPAADLSRGFLSKVSALSSTSPGGRIAYYDDYRLDYDFKAQN